MFGLEGTPVYWAEAREIVASRAQLAAVFRRHRPDVVFHAAACEHLPLLERHPAVAVTTNVAGTMNVASLAAFRSQPTAA